MDQDHPTVQPGDRLHERYSNEHWTVLTVDSPDHGHTGIMHIQGYVWRDSTTREYSNTDHPIPIGFRTLSEPDDPNPAIEIWLDPDDDDTYGLCLWETP